jgi:EpsI family protein
MRFARAGLVTLAFLTVFAIVRPGASAPAAASMQALPLAAAGLTATAADLAAPDVVATLGADQYVYRLYRGDAAAVEMDVAYYSDPRVGRVMHSPLNCLPGNGWQISRMETRTLPGGHQVRTLIAERGETSLALMYWYQTPKRVTASELRSRFNLLADGIQTGRRDTALVRLVVPTAGASEQATRRLEDFASGLIPQLARQFS